MIISYERVKKKSAVEAGRQRYLLVRKLLALVTLVKVEAKAY